MSRIIKTAKMTCLGILALFSFFLWGCGREERQQGIDSCFFQAVQLTGTEDWGYNFKSDGSWLYYMGQNSSLFRLSLEEGAQEDPQVSKAEKFPGGENILDYTVDAEGSLYLYKATTEWFQNSTRAMLKDGVLVKYQADGSRAFEFSLKDHPASYMHLYSTPGFVATDGHGQVLLLSGDKILAIDEAGELAGILDIGPNRPAEDSFGREQLLEGGGGKVYYLSADGSRQTIYEVTKSGETYCLQSMSGKGWEEKTSVLGKFCSSPVGMLYNGTNGVLQQYDPQKGEWQALLRWSDSNLPWDGQEIVSISKDKLMASFTSSTDLRTEFFFLNRKSIDELPQKEELVLTCLYYCPDALEDAAVLFNRSSEQYHITIQVYDDEDAEIRLDAALLSSNPPDMVDLSSLDVEKYCRKQALEDLAPYLSHSGTLRQEDFLDGILEGYTVDGRLAGIPSGFTCHTLLGRTAEVGSRTGWTVDDMISLSQKYPGRKLNGNSFYYNLDFICGNYIMNRFVNREKGECDFNSEEFTALVEWLKEHSGSGTEYYDSEDVDDPLVVWKDTGGILGFLTDFLRIGEETTLIGYPSIDGRPLHHAWTYNAVGISSKSRNKEGAWQFIEAFLSSEADPFSYLIPTRKDMLDRLLEDARTPAYLSFDGEIQYDGNGNPIETAKWITLSEGQHVYHDCATQEETDRFLEILSHTDFSPESSLQSKVTGIIAEETASYFRKEKTLEEVTDVIQNRVSTLLKENL